MSIKGYLAAVLPPEGDRELEEDVFAVADKMQELDADERVAALILAITLLAGEVDYIRTHTMGS